MNARIMMLWGDPVSRALSQAVQEVLGDLAVAFGHRFIFREERFADASIDSYGSVLTQETIDACLECNAVLSVSKTGEGLMSLVAGLDARLGCILYDFPACLQENSRLRSGEQPRGQLCFPISAEPEHLLEAGRQALRLAGERPLRHIPFSGKLRDTWLQALRLAEQEAGGGKAQLSDLDELLSSLAQSPQELGTVYAPLQACLSLDAVGRALSGLPSFVRERYVSDRPILFATRLTNDQADASSPFGLLYAAADMLQGALGLKREADCLSASTTNVLEAGWRTPDIALGVSPRIGTSAICGLIREQIALAGQLITH